MQIKLNGAVAGQLHALLDDVLHAGDPSYTSCSA